MKLKLQQFIQNPSLFFEVYAGPIVFFSFILVFLVVFTISFKRKDWKIFNNFYIPVYIFGFLGAVALFVYNSYFNHGETFLLDNEITALAIPAFFFGLIKLFRTRFKKSGKSSLRRIKKENQDLIAGAFENDPKSEKKLLQALNYYNMEKYDKSITILEELSGECGITKDRHIVSLFLAMNYKKIGETAKAIDLYESLIAVGNANGRIYSNLGTIYIQEGNVRQGIELCKKAATFDPKNPNPYYNVACGYYIENDFDSAIQWAKKTLEVDSDFQEGIALLYLIYTILEQPEEIKKYEQEEKAKGISKSQLKRIVKNRKTRKSSAKSVLSKCIFISILVFSLIVEIINFETTSIFYWLDMIPYVALIIFSFMKNPESKKHRTIFFVYVGIDLLCILSYFVDSWVHQGFFFMFPSRFVFWGIEQAYRLHATGLNVTLILCLLTWLAYYLEYLSFDIPEDDSKKSFWALAINVFFKKIFIRIVLVLAILSLILPDILNLIL